MTSVVANAFSRFEGMLQSESDPRVEEWFMMKSIYPMLALEIAYLYFVLVGGPRYMKGKKPFSLNRVIQLYNIAQIASCAYLTYSFLNSFLYDSIEFGCEGIGYHSYEPRQMKVVSLLWLTIWVKLAEFSETVFFVLRKKYNQVTFLHLYHHVSTSLFMWLGVKYVPGGSAAFPVMLNCIVHVVMYTYYLLTAKGPEWQKRIGEYKKYLTVFQMVQFTIILFHAIYIITFCQPSCPIPSILGYTFGPNVILVFYLFYDFYQRVYTPKDQNSSDKYLRREE